MDLRPYQQQAVDAVFHEWELGRNRTLLVLATGTGKTICFSKVAEECVRRGERVLILAHRKELLDQAQDKLKKATGLTCAVERAEETSVGTFDRVVVGSVQTLGSDKRLRRFKMDHFDTIIIDEAHHTPSTSYQAVLSYWSHAKVLGVTATADRADKKSLGKCFDSIAYEYDIRRGVQEGYLCPIKQQTIPLSIDLTTVKMQGGDFQASDVGRVLTPYLDQIAEEMLTYCYNRKTVVFLPLIEISQNFVDILNSKGFKAEEVNGQSKDRDEIIQRFEDGQTNVLCNSMLLTEGWDCPAVDCVICLRPTKSRGLYCQIIGRGTRLYPGKEDLLILDFLWHIEKHQLCRPASLIAVDDKVANKMTEKAEDGEIYDVMALSMEAEKDILAEREESLKAELEASRRKKARLVDPLQYAYSVQEEALAAYAPAFDWQKESPTPEQIKTLETMGINPEGLDRGSASLLIGTLVERREKGLASPKQIRLLERYGFRCVGEWTTEQASKMIGRLAQAKWRVPNGIVPSMYSPS